MGCLFGIRNVILSFDKRTLSLTSFSCPGVPGALQTHHTFHMTPICSIFHNLHNQKPLSQYVMLQQCFMPVALRKATLLGAPRRTAPPHPPPF